MRIIYIYFLSLRLSSLVEEYGGDMKIYTRGLSNFTYFRSMRKSYYNLSYSDMIYFCPLYVPISRRLSYISESAKEVVIASNFFFN